MKKILALGLCLGMTAGAAFASSTTPQVEKAGYDISNGRVASKASVEAPNNLRAANSIDADFSGSQIVAPVVKTEGPAVEAESFNLDGSRKIEAARRVKGEVPGIVMPEHWDVGRVEDFSLVLTDSYGDGWDGATMDVLVNAVLIHDDITVATGNTATFALSVNDGDLVETVYTAGSWESEHSYAFYDQLGNLVASDGPSPSAGISFTVSITYDVPGCTDPAAPNYNPDATIDDGSCCYTNWVSVTCDGGLYPSEVSWTLVDELGTTVLSGGAPFSANACLADGIYTLNAVDSYGDGWNGNVFTINTDNGPFTYTLDAGTNGTTSFALPLAACEPIACVGTAEAEPNDGPNGDGTVGAIMDGETVCGTAFTYTETDTLGNVTELRDTDWYELILLNDAIVTATLDVESFDGMLLLVASDQATVVASADAAGFCLDETMVSDCLLAGSYYVFVAPNAFTGVETPANYGLSVSLEACTYQSPCDAAIAITCDQTIAGSTVGMPNLVGDASGDQFFNVTVPVDATVTFSLCDGLTDYDSKLRLFDICPTDIGAMEIGYNDDSCGLQSQISLPLVAGSYFLVVEGFSSNEGNYSLAMTCDTCEPVVCTGTPEVEPNDGPNGDGTVGTIIGGETVCGTVFTWTETDTLGNVTNYRDTDWYQLDMASDAIITANLDVEEFDGILILLAADQASVITSADAAGFCGDEVMVSECLPAGTYYVFAAHNDYTGVDVPANYGLSVSLEACTYTTPCDEFVATAITLPYAGTGTNVGAPDVTGSTSGDVGYSFTLTEESTLSWETCLTGTDFDTDSYLFSGDPCNGGTQLIYVDGDSGCSFAAWATGYTYDCGAPLPAGDYTLVISGYGTYTGNFALEVTATPTAEACACDPVVCTGTAEVEPNDGPNGDGTVGSIAEGEVICGNTYTWTETDSLGNVTNLRDTDWYEVILLGDAELTIDLAVDDFNGILFLVADDLATIVASADAAAYCEAEQLLSGCVAAGSYYIVVAHNDFTGVDAGANYSLSYSSVTCTVPTCDNDTYDTAEVIGAFPYSYAGNTSLCVDDLGPFDVQPTQCLQGTYYTASGGAADAYFWFELASATELTFSLCGSSFDTAIGVFADTGVAPTTADIVAYNDDTCSLQSEVVCLMDPGAYYIVVDGYSTAVGEYTLNVTAAALPCDMPVNLAIAMVAGGAELSWDAVGTATSYDVYASTDGYGAYTLLGNSATNSYSDAGAQAAGRKFYKVVAVCP